MIAGQNVLANPYTYQGTESSLLEYIDKCKKGEIIIGHELMLQLDILLEYFEDPDIKIEFEDAHKRIKFIEKECKHFEAPFSGKPFLLELFQKAFIEAIYIFKIYDDEIGRYVRLHQDVLFLVARKNGKTPLISAICLAEWFCGEMGTRILCSSNDYDQAGLMFDAINSMREESRTLSKVTRSNIKGIFFGNPKKPKKRGKFSYQNKGQIKKISAKTNAKEGKNIKVGAVDEVHELPDNTSIMPIRQAVSTQDEPLYIELTTEGVVNDGYLDDRLKEARQVLHGELERPRWLIWMYTQDTEKEIWQDEESWYKSNPGMGAIKKRSFIRKMIEEAKTSKSMRVFVMSKDFNIKQNNATAWLTPEDIRNEETFDIEDFRNTFSIGGVDLSRTGDLASARVIVMDKETKKKYTIQRYWIPESKLENMSREDLKKFKEWVRLGLVEISPGNENDFSLVTAWFVMLYKQYGIRPFKVGYDKWSALYWVKEMEEYGFDCQRVPQEYGSMSGPMKLLEADLKSNMLVHNNNPVDKYCLENTALEMNSKMEMRPVKVQGKEEMKIDGAVTMIIAYKIYIDNRNEFMQLVRR
ncbi:terminase large subunit [Gracilibacillus saliphilus]|uniref:terminase large subunit n=1 Tax=Gracilibacillus saliphilus TaxID=543890 RepID=UPI00192D43E3|nr:terminase TerL endonuclease subunit [Gracilibacillus saliphilus]